MSNAASTWAWKQKCPDAGTKLVLLKLADYADDEGICWPAQKTIADQTGLPRESVCRAVKRLAEQGFLSIEHRSTPSGRLSNIYRLACGSERTLSDGGSHAKVTPRHTLSDASSHKPSRDPSEGKLESLPTKPESTESSNRARAPAAKGAQKGEYAFRRRIIRLTKADFEGWQKTYFTIADLRAKLESLDCFYDQNLTGADRSKWFYRCSAALDKEHQANLKTQAPPSSIDRMALARSRYPHISTERLQELAKSSGCAEYGPRGEYQAWQILRYGEVRT